MVQIFLFIQDTLKKKMKKNKKAGSEVFLLKIMFWDFDFFFSHHFVLGFSIKVLTQQKYTKKKKKKKSNVNTFIV